jgi:ribosomal-protein-alanine N-acetyltransferase
LVAEIDGEIVGQIFLDLSGHPRDPRPVAETAYLYAFRVRPGYRNRGIGSALLRDAERRLMGAGFERAIIAVGKENAAAQRLYRRAGYEILTEDPGQWSYLDHRGVRRQVVEPSYLMAKKLVTGENGTPAGHD